MASDDYTFLRSSLSILAPPIGDVYFDRWGIGITSGAVSKLFIISLILFKKPPILSIDSDAAVRLLDLGKICGKYSP
jgi:hypothetical protein